MEESNSVFSEYPLVDEDTVDKRMLQKRILELERRDQEIRALLHLCENEMFAWENLCDISKNIYALKQKYDVRLYFSLQKYIYRHIFIRRNSQRSRRIPWDR